MAMDIIRINRVSPILIIIPQFSVEQQFIDFLDIMSFVSVFYLRLNCVRVFDLLDVRLTIN